MSASFGIAWIYTNRPFFKKNQCDSGFFQVELSRTHVGSLRLNSAQSSLCSHPVGWERDLSCRDGRLLWDTDDGHCGILPSATGISVFLQLLKAMVSCKPRLLRSGMTLGYAVGAGDCFSRWQRLLLIKVGWQRVKRTRDLSDTLSSVYYFRNTALLT